MTSNSCPRIAHMMAIRIYQNLCRPYIRASIKDEARHVIPLLAISKVWIGASLFVSIYLKIRIAYLLLKPSVKTRALYSGSRARPCALITHPRLAHKANTAPAIGSNPRPKFKVAHQSNSCFADSPFGRPTSVTSSFTLTFSKPAALFMSLLLTFFMNMRVYGTMLIVARAANAYNSPLG